MRALCRFFLEDKALLRRTLPPRQLRLLIRVLASMDTPTGDISAATPLSPLQQAAARLAQVLPPMQTHPVRLHYIAEQRRS